MKLGLNIVWKTDKNEQDAYDVSCRWAFTNPMQKLPQRRTSSDLLILSCQVTPSLEEHHPADLIGSISQRERKQKELASFSSYNKESSWQYFGTNPNRDIEFTTSYNNCYLKKKINLNISRMHIHTAWEVFYFPIKIILGTPLGMTNIARGFLQLAF